MGGEERGREGIGKRGGRDQGRVGEVEGIDKVRGNERGRNGVRKRDGIMERNGDRVGMGKTRRMGVEEWGRRSKEFDKVEGERKSVGGRREKMGVGVGKWGEEKAWGVSSN